MQSYISFISCDTISILAHRRLDIEALLARVLPYLGLTVIHRAFRKEGRACPFVASSGNVCGSFELVGKRSAFLSHYGAFLELSLLRLVTQSQVLGCREGDLSFGSFRCGLYFLWEFSFPLLFPLSR